MIKSVEMFNFQKYKRQKIEFDPKVTVLVGANDSGKSTTMRAIRWVVFNRPLGDGVVRWGEKRTKVRLETDQHLVVRERGESGNNYRLDGGKPYDAINTSVPQPVQDALRLEEVNFQRQIDPPFWFSKTGSEVAKEMNKVVDLEVIERSMSYAAGKVRSGKAEVKLLKGMWDETLEKIKALSWLGGVEKLEEEAIRISQDIDREAATAEGLSRLISQCREASKAVPQVPDTSTIDQLVTEYKKLREDCDGLGMLLVRIEQERIATCRLETSITEKTEELKRTAPKLCPTCNQVLQASDRS